ncbi:hypothetical protein ACSBR1_037806 [Camellia fascicularis]
MVPYSYRVLTGCWYAYRYGCTRTGYGKQCLGTFGRTDTAWVRRGYAGVRQNSAVPNTEEKKQRREERR